MWRYRSLPGSKGSQRRSPWQAGKRAFDGVSGSGAGASVVATEGSPGGPGLEPRCVMCGECRRSRTRGRLCLWHGAHRWRRPGTAKGLPRRVHSARQRCTGPPSIHTRHCSGSTKGPASSWQQKEPLRVVSAVPEPCCLAAKLRRARSGKCISLESACRNPVEGPWAKPRWRWRHFDGQSCR